LGVAASDSGELPSDVKVFNPYSSSYRGSSLFNYIADWRRSKGNVNSAFMKWKRMFYSFGVFHFWRDVHYMQHLFKRLASLLVMSWLSVLPCYALPLTVCEELGHLEVILLT